MKNETIRGILDSALGAEEKVAQLRGLLVAEEAAEKPKEMTHEEMIKETLERR
ncbi:MAG TPA: hypothetical protein VI937_01765 [Negativicutes bacterium]|nr:hypothetical protein [Negativicutes bacterium]